MFSTYALQGLETKTKGEYSREELGPLAQTNVESLKEYGFFTFAKADGKKAKFEEPVDYYLEYKDGRLTLHFTLPLKTPVKAKELVLEVFDPEFFIDFTFADKDPVRLVGAPAACQMKFQRPSDGTATPRSSGKQNFLQRRQFELRRDVRQQDQGGVPVRAEPRFRSRAGPGGLRWPLVLVVLMLDGAVHLADGADAVRRPAPERRRCAGRAALSDGCSPGSRNSTARCPRPFAPRSPTGRRSGPCSRFPSPTASFMPPGPAMARR